jgi:hypothetical protein
MGEVEMTYMRILMLVVIAVCWALPAFAQLQYVKAPISIENARLTHPGEPESVPVAVPVSELIDLTGSSGCVQDFPLLEVEVVQNVLEVTYSGGAISDGGGQLCSAHARLQFDIVLDVPIVTLDPASFVYFFAEATGTFTQLRQALIDLQKDGRATSDQLTRGFSVPLRRTRVLWEPPIGSPGDDSASGETSVVSMIPGDAVRIPVELLVDMAGDTDELGDTEGTIAAQFEFRTLFPQPAPEPSAALSLPMGALWLAGLAGMRGA